MDGVDGQIELRLPELLRVSAKGQQTLKGLPQNLAFPVHSLLGALQRFGRLFPLGYPNVQMGRGRDGPFGPPPAQIRT